MTISRSLRHPWQYRSRHVERARVLLRPICWLRGHQPRMSFVAVFVAEGAPKPPSTFCDRCGKAAP